MTSNVGPDNFRLISFLKRSSCKSWSSKVEEEDENLEDQLNHHWMARLKGFPFHTKSVASHLVGMASAAVKYRCPKKVWADELCFDSRVVSP